MWSQEERLGWSQEERLGWRDERGEGGGVMES